MEKRRYLFTLNGRKMVLIEAYDRDQAAEYLVRKGYRYNQMAMNASYAIEMTQQYAMLSKLPVWNAIG